jgi:hypothetical protein
MTKLAGSWSESGSGSISRRHGSADPYPHQNAMDPHHCFVAARGEDDNFIARGTHLMFLPLLQSVLWIWLSLIRIQIQEHGNRPKWTNKPGFLALQKGLCAFVGIFLTSYLL